MLAKGARVQSKRRFQSQVLGKSWNFYNRPTQYCRRFCLTGKVLGFYAFFQWAHWASLLPAAMSCSVRLLPYIDADYWLTSRLHSHLSRYPKAYPYPIPRIFYLPESLLSRDLHVFCNPILRVCPFVHSWDFSFFHEQIISLFIEE